MPPAVCENFLDFRGGPLGERILNRWVADCGIGQDTNSLPGIVRDASNATRTGAARRAERASAVSVPGFAR